MKSFLVIGLGRFGTSLACELCALGHEVMAVDLREERVQEVAGPRRRRRCPGPGGPPGPGSQEL